MERKYNRIIEGLLYFAIPIILYLIFIFGGFIVVFIESLGYIKALNMTEITFSYYLGIITDIDVLKSSLFSLYLATISTIISVSLGVYLAQYFVFSNNLWINKCMLKLSNILIILPYLFSIFLVIWMFSNTGLLARILFFLGFEQDINFLYDDFGIGMIVTFVLKGSAFVTVYVYNVLSKIKKDYYILAQSMDVSHGKIIMSIYVPLCKNVIVWSSAILFAYVLGSYEVPFLLSNINQNTLATGLYSLYTSPNLTDFPLSMAMNIIMLIINLLFGVIFAYFVNRFIKRGYR